ncbi:MAG TPA: hypothetical protein PKC55_08290 [Dysgonomonas sp.]|uniref:hypothetical protein n=1 Tax=unclassified Dysgonomonas TaxID=2630389 RepID=UPI0025C04F98|nr:MULTISPECIES: hypothetical protein [unclassified Dysgonomonas]HML64809.1 hypothetical protein [Dysgonomonas sp.]
MEFIRECSFWINLLVTILTGIAATIAIVVYFRNRDKISTAFNLLTNFSAQLTLTDLKLKIERLNEFTVNDEIQKIEIINILSEIEGQIIANKKIKASLLLPYEKICTFIEIPKVLTEPKKRSLVSELRESIRNIDILNYKNIINQD